VDIGEPRANQIDTLIRDMIKGLTAATNDHRLKYGNIRLKELLEKRVAEARANSTNSACSVSMEDFIQLLGEALAEIEKHFNLGLQYGLVPSRVAASSDKDSTKPKEGEKNAAGKVLKSELCSGCGGTYHTVENRFLKIQPKFNKSGPWEKSAALAKLKAKCPDDESRHRLNRKYKIDGTELAKPIEIPKRSDKAKGKKGTTVPHDDGATITNMVAVVPPMYRECVITTNASHCRIVKVLFDTGSSPYNFVREEVADWIEWEDQNCLQATATYLRRSATSQRLLA